MDTPSTTAPDTTFEDARSRIDTRMEAYNDTLQSDAVINIIEFRVDDVFLWDAAPVEAGKLDSQPRDGFEQCYRVRATNQMTAGLQVCPPTATPGTRSYERPTGLQKSYVRLLRDWLRGNVIPVREETRFVRRDTGAEVEVNPD